MIDEQPTPSKFINAVDKEMHDSILRLDQKHKGLLAEIQVKKESMALEKTDEVIENRKKHLLILEDEVSQAIESIRTLVNMTVSEELSDEEFNAINQENLESLRQVFDDNIDKITKLQKAF